MILDVPVISKTINTIFADVTDNGYLMINNWLLPLNTGHCPELIPANFSTKRA